MHLDPKAFLETAAPHLGGYYAAACALNVGAAWHWLRRRRFAGAIVWALVAVGLGWLAREALAGRPLEMTESTKRAIDALAGPITVTLGWFGLLVALFLGRRWFVRPAVAWSILNGAIVALGAALADPEFAALATRPDNLPIVVMVFLLGWFTWVGASQAVQNDRRLAEGLPPAERDEDQNQNPKVFVWPDVVYLELIGVVIATTVLIVWSLMVRAPLAAPANPAITPNPSKAPWYFVGLQEALVYFDPWMAGIVLPGLIIVGLMAIPYLDRNPEGRGYYTICQRRPAYLIFQFGFLQLWIPLILIGLFLRGPNWDFFGPFEPRDVPKATAAAGVTLSECFWTIWLGRDAPCAAAGSGVLTRLGTVLLRESAGLVVLGVYYLAVPLCLARTRLVRLYRQWGFWRYGLMMFFLLTMFLLPLKMLLRWSFHLSYLVHMPEFFWNL